jgi:hypothetical protein
MSGAINGSNKKAATSNASCLVTRKQREEAKGSGDICGWFFGAKMQRGRPKKPTLLVETDGRKCAKRTSDVLLLPVEPMEACKKQRGRYDTWCKDPDMFALLKVAVINACAGDECKDDDILCTARLPRTTMRRHKAAFEVAAKQHDIQLCDVTCQMIFPKAESSGCAPLLLTADDAKFHTEIAAYPEISETMACHDRR